jgi:protocatechuate 3,4-dioxygenase beta subunit
MHMTRLPVGLRLHMGLIIFCLAWNASAAQQSLEPTPETALGPEYSSDAQATTRLWAPGDPGQRLHLRGRVLASTGQPIAGAQLQVWQADGAGAYHDDRYRATFQSGEDGGFRLTTALPGQYWGAKHIHVVVMHPDYAPLPTRILFKGDPYLDEAAHDDLAVSLEEVHMEGSPVLLGGVELVMRPLNGN